MLMKRIAVRCKQPIFLIDDFEWGGEIRRNGGSFILLPFSIENINMGLGGSGEDDKNDENDDVGEQKREVFCFIFIFFLCERI